MKKSTKQQIGEVASTLWTSLDLAGDEVSAERAVSALERIAEALEQLVEQPEVPERGASTVDNPTTGFVFRVRNYLREYGNTGIGFEAAAREVQAQMRVEQEYIIRMNSPISTFRPVNTGRWPWEASLVLHAPAQPADANNESAPMIPEAEQEMAIADRLRADNERARAQQVADLTEELMNMPLRTNDDGVPF